MDDRQNLRSQQALTLAADAAALLLASGAETSRAQETAEILFRAFGTGELQAYVLTNGVIAVPLEHSLPGGVRNVPNSSVNLTRVAAVNELSRQAAAGRVSLAQARCRLDEIRHLPELEDWKQILACGIGCACAGVMFGGGPLEAVAASIAGVCVQALLLWLARTGINRIFSRLAGAALVVSVVTLIGLVLPGLNQNPPTIGALMPLTPGVALTMSIRDFISGDYLSGTIRLIDALLTAGCIACGVGLALMAWAFVLGGGAR